MPPPAALATLLQPLPPLPAAAQACMQHMRVTCRASACFAWPRPAHRCPCTACMHAVHACMSSSSSRLTCLVALLDLISPCSRSSSSLACCRSRDSATCRACAAASCAAAAAARSYAACRAGCCSARFQGRTKAARRPARLTAISRCLAAAATDVACVHACACYAPSSTCARAPAASRTI